MQRCGDGERTGTEACDDGNTLSGDGCSSTCLVEPGFECTATSPTVCTHPSCAALAHHCGATGEDDCCAAPLVPGGSFNRSNDASAPATVSPFRLDAFAVTVGRFRKFLAAYEGGWRPAVGAGKNPHAANDLGWDASWPLAPDAATIDSCGGTFTDAPGANEDKPMVCVSWYEAFAFCAWDGGRIVTETEYDYAAEGGSEQRFYAWSNPPADTTIDATHLSYACLGDGDGSSCTVDDIKPVGSYPKGNSRWGQADLAGNVLHWTRDYDATYVTPCNDCTNVTPGDGWRVLRGGGYSYDASYQQAAFRFGLYPTYVRTADLGIRCARLP